MAMTAKADEQTAAPSRGAGEGQPASRPVRCGGQEVHQDRQGARLRDARRAQCRAALRGGLARPDRGHHVDAVRHGHHRGRERGARGGAAAQDARGRRGGGAEPAAPVAAPSLPAVTQTRAEPTERTDDPVRMYLRDMGSVELLSREGEIAIAKRIEAGREAMIAGLCESPLTFQAVIIWRDELNRRQDPAARHHRSGGHLRGPRGQGRAAARCRSAPPPVEAAPPPPAAARQRRRRGEDGEPRPEGELEDEEDFENALSLAAMEAELKPKVLETFDNIAATYKKLRKLQDKKVEMQVASEQFTRQQQKRLRQAARRDHRLRQEPLAQQRAHREPGGAALLHQQAPRGAGEPPDAAGRQLRRAAPDTSSTSTSATSSTRPGSTAWPTSAPQVGPVHQARARARSTRSARRSARSPPRRAWRSPSSAASSRPCRRASARRARPRRRWWRPTCASSSPSPRSTPTAACSSWT